MRTLYMIVRLHVPTYMYMYNVTRHSVPYMPDYKSHQCIQFQSKKVASGSVFTEMDAPFNGKRREKTFWNGTTLAYSSNTIVYTTYNTVNCAFSSVYKATRSNTNHSDPWRERPFAAELTSSLTESESNGGPGPRRRIVALLANGDGGGLWRCWLTETEKNTITGSRRESSGGAQAHNYTTWLYSDMHV